MIYLIKILFLYRQSVKKIYNHAVYFFLSGYKFYGMSGEIKMKTRKKGGQKTASVHSSEHLLRSN